MLDTTHIKDALTTHTLITPADIKELIITEGVVKLKICFGFPVAAQQAELETEIVERLGTVVGVRDVRLTLESKIRAHAIPAGKELLPQVKNIIAVGSGKGGVGKSTTTVNLALALAQLGARVGVLDADIHGPNQPHMVGVQGKPELNDDNKLLPVMAHGLQTMSIGYLVDANTPTVWRGPMVSSALQQLFRDTVWDDLDYLLIDLPPGTGDVQLTLAQKIPVTAAVIVTTPQDIALLDARKAVEMFRKVDVHVLGVVENMSTHTCSACGHEEAIFGRDGAERLARDVNVKLLGQLPLALSIRADADAGKPTVIAQPESAIALNYRSIAFEMSKQIAALPVNYASKMPKVVVE